MIIGYVYDGTPSAGGDGSATRYEVGETITTLPTGTWFPDLTSGSVSFRISGGNAAIDFGNGGYIEEGSNRYRRAVVKSDVGETPSGVAPEKSRRLPVPPALAK